MTVARNATVQTDFLFPEQLSARVGISVQTLARWRCEGRGPGYIKIGSRRVAYPTEAVDAWLEDCKAAALNRHRIIGDDWE